ncbi:MAG: hypothetical protein M0R17_02480 [Candidatus Omnitrophica bacterium]|jgi:hypothetical protein|nr:hypothetical protein [Candidatus Omnitrophota bacterium]
MFKNLIRIIILITLSSFNINATRYYVDNAAANDAGTGAVGSPKKYIPSGIALLSASGGDTVVVKDGTYSGTSNLINTFVNGVSGAYNTLMAENSGGVISTAGLQFVRSTSPYSFQQYIIIKGIKFSNSAPKQVQGQRIKFFECAFQGGAATDNTSTVEVGTDNYNDTRYILFEDCWAYGSGGRYNFEIFNSDTIVMRRVVIRHDGGWTDSKGDPEAGIANYNSSCCEYQNCIVIDCDQTYHTWGRAVYTIFNTYSEGAGGIPHPTNNVNYRGCIILNVDGSGFESDGDGASPHPATDIISNYYDVVCWNSFAGGFSGGSTGGTTILTLNRCTFGGSDNSGGWTSGFDKWDNGSFTITNTICTGYDGIDFSSECAASYCNTYNNSDNGTCSNCQTYSPFTNGLLYPIRIEAGSNLLSAGQSGGQIGATIVKRMGTSGTLWGESGYNTLSDVDLWPWPNEARIKADMAAVSARGFCTGNSMNGQAQSLTKYIWEYAGNEAPSFGSTPVKVTWVGGTSTNAALAANYSPAQAPTSIDTILLNTGSVDFVVGSVINVAYVSQVTGYTGTFTVNDTLKTNYLGLGTCAASFNAPCVIKDSVVYATASTPTGNAGSKIISVAGSTLRVRLNGNVGTPRVVMTSGSKIKW